MLNAAHRRRFRRLVSELNRLREDVAKDHPGACWYLSNDTLNLMRGPSHDDRGQHPLYDNVLDGVTLRGASGGDW